MQAAGCRLPGFVWVIDNSSIQHRHDLFCARGNTPGANNASSSQVHTNTSLVPSSSEPSSNIIPPSTTRGSRVLGKMDSEQALDLYLQGFSPGQGGAEDTT